MNRQKLTFDFNWKLSLFVAFLLPLLLSLGFWQLGREQEKVQLIENMQTQLAQAPRALFSQTHADTKNHLHRAFVIGRFITDRYWLRENQRFHGQLGYHVLMPFISEQGEIVVVNRGWIQGSPLRDFYPDIDTPSGQLRLNGLVQLPSDSKLIEERENTFQSWPHKILEVDLEVMSKQLNQPVFDRILRLDADSPAALTVSWKMVNMAPEKHRGYAVQWFSMAGVLIVLYILASTNLLSMLRRNEDNSTTN